MLSQQEQDSLTTFASAAVAAERSSATWLSVAYPAEVIVAQWAVETGWGLKGVTGDYNVFGLTAATCPGVAKKFCPTEEELTSARFNTLPADERESVTNQVNLGGGHYRYSLSRWFASFNNLTDAIEAYVQVITHPGHRFYAGWLVYVQDQKHSIDALITSIAANGYASGAGYRALLIGIAHSPHVTNALLVSRQSAEPKLIT